jgi:Uncharacterized protein conserved in bacteria
MKLTENFELKEFTRSNNAERLNIDNTPNEEQIENLRRLCVRVLQPLREAYRKPMYINSGYRSSELNKRVGGVATSQHLKGEAADVRVDDPRKLLTALLEFRLDFDQAILYNTFLHISYSSGHNRRQVLYAKGVQP